MSRAQRREPPTSTFIIRWTRNGPVVTVPLRRFWKHRIRRMAGK